MNDGRKHTFARPGAALAAVMIMIAGLALTSTVPAAAAPDKKDVARAEATAKGLYHEAEIASERYNDARVTLAETRLRLRSLGADLRRQQATVDAMRSQVATMVVSNYQDGALSTASQVVLSQNPDSFIDNLSAVTTYNSQRGEAMREFGTEMERLSLRKKAVKEELGSVSRIEHRLATEKRTIDTKAAAAKKALAGIRAKVRAARTPAPTASTPASTPSTPASTPSTPASTSSASVPASGRAGAAIGYAMAQVGKAYVFGAAGPSAFDCSGLTMMAWAQAGVALPHSSSAQYSSGQHVSEADLQPGDLVFYYSPISHVGMYIGGGKIVNAENPSVGIKVTDLHAMPYVGAVRPG